MPASTTLDPQFCNQVNRVASGTITSIGGVLQNIGGIETDGFDINFNVATAESGVGRFDFQLMASFLLNYDELIADSDERRLHSRRRARASRSARRLAASSKTR